MRLGWVYDRRFLLHDTGDVHPERPQRLLAIVETLENAGFMHHLEPIEFRAATRSTDSNPRARVRRDCADDV